MCLRCDWPEEATSSTKSAGKTPQLSRAVTVSCSGDLQRTMLTKKKKTFFDCGHFIPAIFFRLRPPSIVQKKSLTLLTLLPCEILKQSDGSRKSWRRERPSVSKRQRVCFPFFLSFFHCRHLLSTNHPFHRPLLPTSKPNQPNLVQCRLLRHPLSHIYPHSRPVTSSVSCKKMGAATMFSLGLLCFLQFAVLNHASPAHYLSGHATDAVKAATVSSARFVSCAWV